MSYSYYQMDFDEEMMSKYKNHPEHNRFIKLCKNGINYGKLHRTVFWTDGDQEDIIDFFGKKYEEFDEVEKDAHEYIEYKLEYYFETMSQAREF